MIAKYSIARAAGRFYGAKRMWTDPDEDVGADRTYVWKQAKEFVLDNSDIGDDWPLCCHSNRYCFCFNDDFCLRS